MLWLLGSAILSSAAAANPHCLAALAKSCAAVKGSPTCDSCINSHQLQLMAAGCRRIDEAKYCGDAPKPQPIRDPCLSFLRKICKTEQNSGEAKCDQCVGRGQEGQAQLHSRRGAQVLRQGAAADAGPSRV